MNTTLAEAGTEDPVLSTVFAKEMVRQTRALDTHGTHDACSDGWILEPFILTPEKKRAIPLVGDPDEIVIARV
ncbi:MAG: DUF269 domain-containing protein, partial [Chromatiaceae bacterium]|nr:DUF269 domain-containing protein [Chromatiaceae bacterium]